MVAATAVTCYPLPSLVATLLKDAWGGYVSLAGDTHNAWHSDLVTASGTRAGVEFATSSVTSPGFKALFGNDSETIGGLEQALTILIDNFHYLNASDRGYVMASFSNSVAQAEWSFVKQLPPKTPLLLPATPLQKHKLKCRKRKATMGETS